MSFRTINSVQSAFVAMPAKAMIWRAIFPFAAVFLALASRPAYAEAQVPVALELDLLEVHFGQGGDHLLFDSTLTLGDGANTVLVKMTGGSETRTAFDDFELQGLYSRALSEKTALHFGVRRDFRAGSDLTYGVAGLVAEVLPGLEVEHYLFASQRGDVTGAGQAILNIDLAPRLVFEPRIAIGWSAQDVIAEALSSGFTDLEASIRLRRELSGTINAYAGVVHERLLGGTRANAVLAGDPAIVTRAVLGIGASF